jgi:hypothetical protein
VKRRTLMGAAVRNGEDSIPGSVQQEVGASGGYEDRFAVGQLGQRDRRHPSIRHRGDAEPFSFGTPKA